MAVSAGPSGRLSPFNGRVFFDHLPKTAGQAINAWLRQELGPGAVTENLDDEHYEVIRRWGGLYSVLSAHISFGGYGLDPRYDYITCLREPVERALSWLYFVRNNHRPELLEAGLWRAVDRFLASDGEDYDPLLRRYIENYYVDHFAAAVTVDAADPVDRLAAARQAIAHYRLYGFTERLNDFVTDVGTWLQIPVPAQLGRVNATRDRPGPAGIPRRLRDRLADLNRLDAEFYQRLVAEYEAHRQDRGNPPPQSRWDYCESPQSRLNRLLLCPDLTLQSIEADGFDMPLARGTPLRVELTFALGRPIGELGIGLHIHDQDGVRAFGTNSMMLGKQFRDLDIGIYGAAFDIDLDLPAGHYLVGFAFVERASGGWRDLVWYDRALDFYVRNRHLGEPCGYARLPTELSLCRKTPSAGQAPEPERTLAPAGGLARLFRWIDFGTRSPGPL
jgi:hypothetical protein